MLSAICKYGKSPDTQNLNYSKLSLRDVSREEFRRRSFSQTGNSFFIRITQQIYQTSRTWMSGRIWINLNNRKSGFWVWLAVMVLLGFPSTIVGSSQTLRTSEKVSCFNQKMVQWFFQDDKFDTRCRFLSFRDDSFSTRCLFFYFTDGRYVWCWNLWQIIFY